MRQGEVYLQGQPEERRPTTDVTIRAVDGGFILEWVEIKEREMPPGYLGPQQGLGKAQGPKVKIPVHKQAVREKLSDALKLVESILKRNAEIIRKGGDGLADIFDLV